MVEYVKIPKDRVGVLIGEEGTTKRMLEKRCEVKLDITHDGSVTITSPEEDGLREWKALDVVKAIGRGFNPRFAVAILKEDCVLSIIDLYDIFSRKESDINRVKARVIGEHGKAWQTIELLTNTKMSVYGRTIALIGLEDDVELATRAIDMIIRGSSHPNVYRFLEREGSKRKTGF
jgi:ribosomal RNA assembly protein